MVGDWLQHYADKPAAVVVTDATESYKEVEHGGFVTKFHIGPSSCLRHDGFRLSNDANLQCRKTWQLHNARK